MQKLVEENTLVANINKLWESGNPSGALGRCRERSWPRDGAHKIRRAMSSATLHDVSRIHDPASDAAKH